MCGIYAQFPKDVLRSESLHRNWYIAGAAITTTVAGLYLIRKYFAGSKCHCSGRLDSKTVIITGGNSGIGKATAKALLDRGARIILACRNIEAANETIAELKASSQNDNIKAMHLDLASFASVRSFVQDFLSSEMRVDILINNAGTLFLPRSITEDGHEIIFQTNYLGHFLLTLLLLDHLRAFAPSRIINVSSMGYKCCSAIEFEDLRGKRNYSRRRAYDHSKLAQVLFTRVLAEKLKGMGVTVNAVHPGVVDTTIFKNYPWLCHPVMKIINWPFVKLFFKSPEAGAQTSIHCAISRECERVTGCYFRDCAIEMMCPNALDDVAAKKLWVESLKLVGLPQQ